MRFALLLAAMLLAGCEPAARTFEKRQPVPIRAEQGATPPQAGSPARLKVMTWNVKYVAGRIDFWFDYWGDRVEMTRDEVLTNLAALEALIAEVRPDVLLVQEIEINSRRSAYIDQVAHLLENTHLQYAAYFPTWDSRYVPSEGLGRINMGNAILSTFPITFAESIPQSDRTDLGGPETLFYLHRVVGRAVLDVGGRELAAMVVHTEAYDQDGTKARQLQEILALLEAEPLPFLIGGDFNAIPPGSAKVAHFNDEHPSSIGTSFEQPPYALEDLRPFYEKYLPAITLARYGTTEEQQRRYYTHSVLGPGRVGSQGEDGFWTRTLDYLFLSPSQRWDAATTDVLQKPGDSGIASNPLLLSDHCPVVGVWEVSP